MTKNKKIFIISGEASGDIYGAKLVKVLNKKLENIFFVGIGGTRMQAAGVKILVNSKELSIMGITEIIPKIPFLIHTTKLIKKNIKKNPPNLLILIDFPDFNLHIASKAKKLNIPILYYVSPQLWAWRKSRLKKIRKLINHMAVILPFEEKFYKKNKIPASFVGHPMLDDYPKLYSRQIKINNKNNIITIGLLPGSRNNEILNLLPIMIESAILIKKNILSVRFIISCTNSVNNLLFNKIIKKYSKNIELKITKKPVKYIFEICNCLIVASGTVSLEAAFYGIPMIIIYKVSFISYLIAKIMINLKYVGLVNIIYKKKIIPELIQKEANSHNITKYVLLLIKNKEYFLRTEKKLLQIKNFFKNTNASEQVANIAMKIIN